MQLTSLVGRKLYQKQAFLQDGTRVPLSGIRVLGNVITQVKSADKEGYNALQLGIETKKRAKKSLANHSKKAGLTNTPAFLREVRVDDVEGAIAGTEINPAEVFEVGDIVDVVGISKGKGFAGGVKRFQFRGGPRTHGQSDRERAPGSIGQTTTPGRVYKGKRMAGRMGSETVTVQNLEVAAITEDGILLVIGLIPGSVNTIVVINKKGVNKKFVPLYKEVVDEPVVEEVVVEAPIEEPVVAAEVPAETAVAEVEPETILAETAEEKAAEEPIVEAQAETQSEEKTEVKEGEENANS
jgi:large subunit ribosomal protein L3